MTQPVAINSQHPLVGTWSSFDDFSEVLIVIGATSRGFVVNAIDKSDDEIAEVFDVNLIEDIKLSFNLHWPMTGRFIKYTFTLSSDNKVDVVYTYSGQEVWGKS